ncbi:hypothetical protein ACFQ4L_00015 [Lapidilactobacillus mulanensis]|uniref:Uncharacterized protein n=1 Tax=Lapidilactobacillus mulanensis TaxID=2485999 RepID=A0ABW4DMJ2_9LACO|nr:hypothetical protein [Lapidilactobacillus mulanensis]
MSPILIYSINSIAEKIGLGAKITTHNFNLDDQLILDRITIYNNDREIFGKFFSKDEHTRQITELTFGPLLMAEVKFGSEDLEDNLEQFRGVLKNLFVVTNRSLPQGFDESSLTISSFYKKSTFTYNALSEIGEYYKLELLLFAHIKDRNKMAAFRTLSLCVKYYYKFLTVDQLKCFYISIITLLTRVEIEKGYPVNKLFDKQFQLYGYLPSVQNMNSFESLTKKAIRKLQ